MSLKELFVVCGDQFPSQTRGHFEKNISEKGIAFECEDVYVKQ